MYAGVLLTRPTHRRLGAGAEPLHDPSWRAQSFAYRVPGRLEGAAAVGQLVRVPLQAGTAPGVIASLGAVPPAGVPAESLRELLDILDPLPVMTPLHLELARWMAEQYAAPIGQALRLMLPPGIEERTFVVAQRRPGRADGLADEEAQLLGLLDRHGGKLKLSALAGRLRGEEGETALERLAERGLVETHLALVPPRAAPPRVAYASLLADDATIEAALPRLGRASKQADVLLLLAGRPDTPPALEWVCAQAGCTPAALEPLVKRGWVSILPARTLVLALPEPDPAVPAARPSPKQAAALEALRRRPAPPEWAAFAAEERVSVSIVRELERKRLVERIDEPALVLLELPREEVVDRIVELRGGGTERAVLEALRGAVGRVWVGGLYAETGANRDDLRRLAERGLISLHARPADPPQPAVAGTPLPLTAAQEAAWAQVQAGLAEEGAAGEARALLLRGGPGSGKTEICLRAVEQTLAAGRRCLVLAPEIGLAEEAFRRIEARFPRRVALLHGRRSLGQRYDAWDGVRRGEVDVLVGSRAALFAPLSRLGLVVVLEAHDSAYKQQEPFPPPAYHACDVAAELGRQTGAAVIYATATPSLEMAHGARRGTVRLVELPGRPVPAPAKRGEGTVAVRVVDLRQELYAGNRSIFSRALQQALGSTLAAGEQAILFLNRRGSAAFVLCRDCGHVARCPSCGIPLSLHRPGAWGEGAPGLRRAAAAEGLVCHRCGYRSEAPEVCPACRGRHIRPLGLGTERVESELHRLFPEVRALRWDGDVAEAADPLRYLQAFAEHRADVLVGTQMVARGLDLARVTLVGVVSADTFLNLPDFRAGERTFQILAQIAGLGGRGGRGGQVILQTYEPEHHAVRAVAERSHEVFYRQELVHRQRLGYPPFRRLLALRYEGVGALRCEEEARRLARWLRHEMGRSRQAVDLIGPAPCFYGQGAGRCRWQILLRGDCPADLVRDVVLPGGWRIDVDPISVL